MMDFRDFDPDGDDVINREVIEHRAPTTDRSQARRVALQGLYEIDHAKHNVGDVLNSRLAASEDNRRVHSYLTRIVHGVLNNLAQIDGILQEYAPEWPIHQVAVIDRNILRIATYELIIERSVPVGVAIDEAIELSKLFGADNTPRFVNGVLGAIADNLDIIREGIPLPEEDDDEDDDLLSDDDA